MAEIMGLMPTTSSIYLRSSKAKGSFMGANYAGVADFLMLWRYVKEILKPFIEKIVNFFLARIFPPKKIFCYNLQLLPFSTESNNIKCWTRGAFTIILSETWKWVAGCCWVIDSFQKYIYNFAEVNRYFEDIK